MRLWPDIPPAVSTCIALTALNTLVFVVWKRPEAWRSMNRYFLLSAGHPNAFSVLGSVFSHQFLGHLFRNSLFLFLVGIPVHEEIGRGAFLALYLTSGVAGSLASLWTRVLTKSFLAASLGSSSAVYGLVGAYFMLQDSRKIGFGKSKDDESQDYSLSYDARIALFFVLLYEIVQWRRFGRAVDGKDGAMDHLTHLGGLAAGAVMGYWLRLRAEGRSSVGKNVDYYQRSPIEGGAAAAAAAVSYPPEKGGE
jgi:rhomboid-like protein